jgi:Eco57I restriction-modification methylase/TaqI-like C-terminal specificity domain
VRDLKFLKENEKPHQGAFLSEVFGTLFGYGQMTSAKPDGSYSLRAESASKETAGGKTPDAQIGFFGPSSRVRGVVELKAPNADLDARQNRAGRLTPVEQGFGYVSKFDGCRWVIVSNFVSIRLYWTVRGEAYVWTLDVSRLNEPAVLAEALTVLHADRLLGTDPTGSPPTLVMAEASLGAEKAIADGFYKLYRDTRFNLFKALASGPRTTGDTGVQHERRSLQYAQTVLDRLLFICFAEDKELLPAKILANAMSQTRTSFAATSSWQQLSGLFTAIDKGHANRRITAFNGGLFAPTPGLDDRAILTDDDLGFIEEMASYDFANELGVEVLGRVFERSISDLEAIHDEIDGRETQQTSKRKRDGVFYTPDWVTRFIAQQTVGRWLERYFADRRAAAGVDEVRRDHHKRYRAAEIEFWERYQKELSTVKIVDPACGSGAFLVAAYDVLLAEYERANSALASFRGGQTGLFDPDRQILEGNLYGVDINSESVEITRLSLWLKTAQRERPLTALDRTIQCGNALMAPPEDSSSLVFASLAEQDRRLAFDWTQAFPEVFDSTVRSDGRVGFDVVLGNPPYVRGEWLPTATKAMFASTYAVHANKADLLVYFYERSISMLAPGGLHSFIVSNKWLKAGYGEPLRKWLSENTNVTTLVDFGHSPIFEDADTFPIITISENNPKSNDVLVAAVPRADLGASGLSQLIEQHGFRVARSRFTAAQWSLEPPEIDDLMRSLRSKHPNLTQALGKKCMYGIKTGYNEAFIVNRNMRNALVKNDPTCADLLKPVLGGRDIHRWNVKPADEWMIMLASSNDHHWPWTDTADPEQVFADTHPSLHRHLSADTRPGENRRAKLEGRSDQGRHWWELRSCAYYDELLAPKIVYTDIAWQPEIAIDTQGVSLKNTAYFLPGAEPWVAAILNSPVVWWYAWRAFQHGKDEALRWFAADVEMLPFPVGTSEQRDEAKMLVPSTVDLTNAATTATDDFNLWLKSEFGLTRDVPDSITSEQLLIRVRGAKNVLSVSDTARVRSEHQQFSDILTVTATELQKSEARIAQLVEDAFGLSALERALLRSTAPPRTPVYNPPVSAA